MSTEKEVVFDPYHKWLGISKADRPVTFYKLLGLSNGESDAEVIEEAAIRQTTHLRAYQVGAHAAECTRLLNEVATARQVLINPVKRKEYDAKLAQIAAKRAAAQASKAAASATVVESAFADLDEAFAAGKPGRDAARPPGPEKSGKHGKPDGRRSKHDAESEPKEARSRMAVIALIGGSAAALVVVAALAAIFVVSSQTPMAHVPPPPFAVQIPPKLPAPVVPVPPANDPKPVVAREPKTVVSRESKPVDPVPPIRTFSLRVPGKDILALSDGRVLYGGYPILQQFEPAENRNRIAHEYPQTGSRGVRFAVSPDGRFIHIGVPDANQMVTFLFDDEKASPVGRFAGVGEVCRLALSRDGSVLVIASYSGDVSVWNAFGHVKMQTLQPHPRPVRSIALNRNISVVATLCDQTIQVWSLRDSRLVASKPNSVRATSVAFGPDGKSLVLAAPTGIFTGSAERLEWSPLIANPARMIAFANARTLVALSPADISLYEWPSGKLLKRSSANVSAFDSMSLTPDGKIVFVSRADSKLEAFAIEENATLKQYLPANEAPAPGPPRYVGDWHFPDNPSHPEHIDLRIKEVDGVLSAQLDFRRLTSTGKARVAVLESFEGHLRGKLMIEGDLPDPWAEVREVHVDPPAVDGLMRVTLRSVGRDVTCPFRRVGSGQTATTTTPMPAIPATNPTPTPPVTTPKNEPVVVVRAEAPADERIKELTQTIRTTYKADYAKKSPADRADLAEKLLKLAAESKDDPAARYALYSEARDVAAAAGNWPIAADALEDIEAEFTVDVLPHKEAALALLVKSDLGKESAAAAAETALQGVGAAIAADELPLAAKFLRLAATAAAKAQSAPHTGLYRKADAELKLIHAEADAVQNARETLKTMPDDAVANLAVGSYEALRRGNWESALPLLAKGGDGELAKAARKELSASADAAGAQKIGDDWWAAAEKQKAEALGARAALRSRAAHWYRRALPQSTGLTLAVIAERLKTIDEAPTPFRLGGPANAALRTLTGHHGAVTSLFVTPDGKRLFTGSLDGTMKSWDLKLGKMSSNYAAGQPILSLGFSPSGRYVAIGFKAAMKVVEVDRPMSAKQLPGAEAFPGTYWADDNRVGYIDKENHHIATLNLGSESLPVEIRLRSLQISPSRTQIAALGQETHLIYLNAKGSLDSRRKAPFENSTCAAFSTPEGVVAIASLDKRIRIYETMKFSVVQTLEGDTVIQCLAFLPGGARLLSAGDDGLVRFWDTSTGKEVRRFATGSTGVMSILVTPDGKQIITGGVDGVVRVWAMPRENPPAAARKE
jgi:WD40 repeat protein